MNDKSLVKWKKFPLGKKPDSVISKMTGMSVRSICQIRKKLKIPAFRGLTLTKEGLSCRSIYEAMYDCYLHENNLKHEHEKIVPNTRCICDFVVNGEYVEIAGMMGFPKYDKRMVRKKEDYKRINLSVTWLDIDDVEKLYKTCKTKIKFIINRKCSMCGKKTHAIVQRVCRTCYMKKWHKKPKIESKCDYCGKLFFAGEKKKYCCRQCYWNSLKFDWPSDEVIKEKLQIISANKFSKELGVTISGLRKYMKQRNIPFVRLY
jgi:hypothetical protein